MGRAKEIVMKVIPAKVATPFMKAHHYSGKVVNNSTLHFGVFLDGQLHGVMSYGPSLDKSKIIGLVKDTGWNEFLELNRMAFDSYLPRNSESRAISMSIKLLKKYAPQIKWVVSFADACSCGDGTIYRASNFVLTGIKENLNLAELPDGSRVHKMTLASNPTSPRNPRRDLKPGDKDYEKLKRSIAEFGFVEPVVWNERTGFVVGGHQRLKVLLDMGVTEIDCVVVDLEPEREKALNVALNRIQGDWDERKLAEVLADIDASAFDVSFTGFDAEEMDALMNKFYSADAEEDGFDREAAAEKVEASGGAVTVPGDIWQLGGHRLLCGNGADAGAMGLLMGKERAACAVCAPPAVSMEEYKKNGMEPWISRMGEAVALLCRYADIVCWNVDDLFSTGSQYMEPVAFESMKLFSDCNFRPLWIRVWKKQGIMARAGSAHLSSAKPQKQFEYVAAFGGGADEEVNEQEYGWVSAFAAHSYRFVKRLTKEERRKWGYAGVWEIASMPAGADGVPMVPVELPWRCMKMHSDPGGLVLDPFAGGGTVLIAAEQSGRRCFAMEGDPLKCDLIVMRWEQFTGEKAVRLGAADAGPENEGE